MSIECLLLFYCESLRKQASFRKHFILMCHFTMCESRPYGGKVSVDHTEKKRKKKVRRNLHEKG